MYYEATVSHGTTGVKTRTVGFQPLGAQVTVTPAPSGVGTEVKESVGSTNGTIQTADSNYISTARCRQVRYTDRLISIWVWNGSAYVEDFRLDFDSFTATEFKYNVVIANSAYQLKVQAWG